jgi:hypothetical protein
MLVILDDGMYSSKCAKIFAGVQDNRLAGKQALKIKKKNKFSRFQHRPAPKIRPIHAHNIQYHSCLT